MVIMHEICGRLRRPVDGLLFGLEGVLFDDTLWRQWLFRLLRRYGVETDFESFCRHWNTQCLRPVCRGEQLLSEAFLDLLTTYGLASVQAKELMLACRARWRQHHRECDLLPGVKKTIGQLRDTGFVLGVLSDSECPGEQLLGRLEQSGLQSTFVSVISSVDVGHTKPAAVGYLRSARTMHLDPRTLAFVGRRSDELAGATMAGMQTITLNRHAYGSADVCLGRFEQLIDLFNRRQPIAAAG